MDRVLDRLYIGDSGDLRSPILHQLGFRAVLDLRDAGTDVRGIDDVHRVTNRDGDPWTAEQVNTALDFVQLQIRFGRVLIACAAGMSRSASMVVGFLVRSGWDAPSALEHLRRCRPIVAPMPAMLESVLAAVQNST